MEQCASGGHGKSLEGAGRCPGATGRSAGGRECGVLARRGGARAGRGGGGEERSLESSGAGRGGTRDLGSELGVEEVENLGARCRG